MLDTQSTDCTLVVMAKAPRVGAVKTRLARNLSPLVATDLYRCLLEDTLTLAHALRGVEVAVMCPAADVEELSRMVSAEVCVVAQNGEGLAAGLTSVFVHFAAAGRRRVIAFNSDSPHLPVSVLEKAFDMLAVRDLVVGPTDDGGYYLVGARASHSGLFARRGLGTANALEALLARARALGLSAYLTDPFWDIDVVEDLIPLAAELRLAPARALRTAAWLKKWKHVVEELPTGTKGP